MIVPSGLLILLVATVCLGFSFLATASWCWWPDTIHVRFGSSCQRQRTSQNLVSSLTDLTPRIDPYSVVIGPARRSEFQSKLACPLEGLRRITRRERHGSGYVRKASASRGGKHR